MVDVNSIIGSLLTVYNNTGSLVDPVANRNGSFFFGPNQEVTFRNEGPKGKVTGGVTYSDEPTYGSRPIRTKHYNIYVSFYAPHGFIDITYALKNEELVHKYLDLIEQTTINNVPILGQVVLEKSVMPEDPFLIPDMNVHAGRYTFVFKDRK